MHFSAQVMISRLTVVALRPFVNLYTLWEIGFGVEQDKNRWFNIMNRLLTHSQRYFAC